MMLPAFQEMIKNGGDVYLVGGSVRDELMGIPVKDRDYVVSKIPMEQLGNLLSRYGYVKLVGKSFGVLKFNPFDEAATYDIALPRVETSTGVGHRDFNVNFDPMIPIEVDLGRRDFTINSMAQNIRTQEIIDPYHGQEDLKNRTLRMVFKEAFNDDPLRMLRAIQFTARFNLNIETNTYNAIQQNAELIKSISSERIVEEIKKLFLAEKPSHGFDLMRDTGLLTILFPELQKTINVLQPPKHGGDVYGHTMKVLDAARACQELDQPGNIDIMFAALFHDIGKPATRAESDDGKTVTFYGHQNVSVRMTKKWMRKYPIQMIGANTDAILNLVSNHMFETKSFYGDKAIRRFIYKVGKENVLKLVDLRIADKKGGGFPNSVKGIFKLRNIIKEELSKKPPFSVKDLAINGHNLMELGIAAGPNMGHILKAVVEHVVDDPKKNELEYLKQWVKEHFLS